MLLRIFSQEVPEPEQSNISKDGRTECSEGEMGRGEEDLFCCFYSLSSLSLDMCVCGWAKE